MNRGELEERVREILSCDAFELHRMETSDGKLNIYIPYMMNDALECYFVLEDVTMTGAYLPEYDEEISVDFVDTERGAAAIFHQGPERVFTIWYENSYFEQKCYRYDQIGHFWVEGEEHWRRLVYIIGTIHDKYSYMGPDVCNELEISLMPLMEFAPFRSFSPIHESLDSYYEDTAAGMECMERLAYEAGDREFLYLIRFYKQIPFKKQAAKHLAKAMQSWKRGQLYDHIFEKVQAASSMYEERTYSDQLHIEIQKKREEIQATLTSHGFSGTYPLFQKSNMQILAMEEHPFTILESEHYEFKIRYMVSEIDSKDKSLCIDGENRYIRNAGFFKKRGNRGWIAKNLEFL